MNSEEPIIQPSLIQLRDALLADANFKPFEGKSREDSAWIAAWQNYRQKKNNEKALNMAVESAEPEVQKQDPDYYANLGQTPMPRVVGKPSEMPEYAKPKRRLLKEGESWKFQSPKIASHLPRRRIKRFLGSKVRKSIKALFKPAGKATMKKQVRNVFAIATQSAKKAGGYKSFKEGSAGAKKRSEIAEAIKEKMGMKKFQKGKGLYRGARRIKGSLNKQTEKPKMAPLWALPKPGSHGKLRTRAWQARNKDQSVSLLSKAFFDMLKKAKTPKLGSGERFKRLVEQLKRKSGDD